MKHHAGLAPRLCNAVREGLRFRIMSSSALRPLRPQAFVSPLKQFLITRCTILLYVLRPQLPPPPKFYHEPEAKYEKIVPCLSGPFSLFHFFRLIAEMKDLTLYFIIHNVYVKLTPASHNLTPRPRP